MVSNNVEDYPIGTVIVCSPYDWVWGWDNEEEQTITATVAFPGCKLVGHSVFTEHPAADNWWVKLRDIKYVVGSAGEVRNKVSAILLKGIV